MVLTSTYNLYFDQKYEKYPNFYLKIFIFWWLKFSVYVNRLVFVMLRTCTPSKDSDQSVNSAVSSESSLDAYLIAKDAQYYHVDNEDSDQTERMRRLIESLLGIRHINVLI